MRSSNSALLTDFYQLTMAQGLWKAKKDRQTAVFYLFFRRTPFKGSYAIFSGLEPVINYLKSFKYSKEDLGYLRDLKNPSGRFIFDKKFLTYLKNLKFSCDLYGPKEGTVIFPFEPLLRIYGPLIQCQILESALLNLVNFSTLISTKASRVCTSAEGDEVMEFGMRRAQGALTASRAAYIGGCHSTSNVLAGKTYKIPVRGTHSHSWIMSFPSEMEAFETYAKAMPEGCIFLVDTYATLNGVKNAIEVGKKMRKEGYEMVGVRLDSGNLLKLSKETRKLLDGAGFKGAQIVASGDLDEYTISKLKKSKCPISIWGVGTKLVTGFDQPALDGVYKLGAIEDENGGWIFKMKLTDQDSKITLPGIIQIRRVKKSGKVVRDILYNETGEKPKLKGEDLLIPIFKKGKCVYKSPSLTKIRDYAKKSLESFSPDILKIRAPKSFDVLLESSLLKLKKTLTKKIQRELIK